MVETKKRASAKDAFMSNDIYKKSAKVMPHHCGLPAQMHQAEEKLRELRSGSKLVTAEERAAVESAFLTAADAWAKRKRMFKSIWCAAVPSGHVLPL